MTIGFIGAGNMASAMIKGFSVVMDNPGENLLITDIDTGKAAALSEMYGAGQCSDAEAVCERSDIVILAVKPQVYPKVLPQLAEFNDINTKLIVSIAPGISLASLASYFQKKSGDAKPAILRIMPNTPALVGEGMFALCPDADVQEGQLTGLENLLKSIGKTDRIPEYLMDAVTGISGCGPAYAFMFMEAMADGAVLKGIPRQNAYVYAAQTMLGAAKMVLESGLHPGELKDRVTSPGGVTIEAVRILEEKGLRSAVMEAVARATEKSASMG